MNMLLFMCYNTLITSYSCPLKNKSPTACDKRWWHLYIQFFFLLFSDNFVLLSSRDSRFKCLFIVCTIFTLFNYCIFRLNEARIGPHTYALIWIWYCCIEILAIKSNSDVFFSRDWWAAIVDRCRLQQNNKCVKKEQFLFALIIILVHSNRNSTKNVAAATPFIPQIRLFWLICKNGMKQKNHRIN